MRANHAFSKSTVSGSSRAVLPGVHQPGNCGSSYQDDLKARRARVAERLGPDAVAIFWSAPARVFSTDVNYEFRQESNLLYLTGIDQEDTILVLVPGSDTQGVPLRARGGPAARTLEWPQPHAVRSGIRRAASRR